MGVILKNIKRIIIFMQKSVTVLNTLFVIIQKLKCMPFAAKRYRDSPTYRRGCYPGRPWVCVRSSTEPRSGAAIQGFANAP